VTFLINDWRHGSEHLVQIDPQPQHLYYTTQQNETPGTQTVYQCQRPGIFCTVVAAAPADRSAQSSGVSGAAGANLDTRSHP
jgi:hypothetical protein